MQSKRLGRPSEKLKAYANRPGLSEFCIWLAFTPSIKNETILMSGTVS